VTTFVVRLHQFRWYRDLNAAWEPCRKRRGSPLAYFSDQICYELGREREKESGRENEKEKHESDDIRLPGRVPSSSKTNGGSASRFIHLTAMTSLFNTFRFHLNVFLRVLLDLDHGPFSPFPRRRSLARVIDCASSLLYAHLYAVR